MPDTPPLWADPSAREPERAWLETPSRPQPPVEPPEPPAPRRRTSRWLIAGVATLALLSAGLGGALLATSGEDDTQRAAGTLPAVSGSIAQTRAGSIYAAVASGVVQVRTSDGSGTGFVIEDDGTIVTNAHVVDRATSAKVIFDDSDKAVPARILGRDESTDLAVLKVEPGDAPKLRPLVLADSDTVQVGDNAIAIGYPLGLDRTVTAGIISGLGREIQAPNGFSIDKVIQTDAPINPGNSGGPLLDAKGRVIGVNSQIATDGASQGNVGIGFAVPSNTVREIVPKLELGQTIAHPYMGVSTSEAITGSGALVRRISPGSPAAKAGLQAASSSGEGGDLIVAIAGTPIAGPDDVINVVTAKQPGDEVAVVVIRDGKRTTVDVTLGTRPRTP
ncbi:MAG TPA: trypsin-like peptidase domain-containing protein [Solirubrobacteraceae bacterium]|nr:trypsin-like peptidase domain-containing protein [Solirubrobacteraceae bacterium]